MRWVHAGWWARRWDLVDDGETIASLALESWTGQRSRFHVAGRTWTIRRRGVVRWRCDLQDEPGNRLATMRVGWRGRGEITLHDGRRFSFDPEDVWGSRWILTGPALERVAHVRLARFLRQEARVDVEASDLARDDLLALLALSWLGLVFSAQAAVAAGA